MLERGDGGPDSKADGNPHTARSAELVHDRAIPPTYGSEKVGALSEGSEKIDIIGRLCAQGVNLWEAARIAREEMAERAKEAAGPSTLPAGPLMGARVSESQRLKGLMGEGLPLPDAVLALVKESQDSGDGPFTQTASPQTIRLAQLLSQQIPAEDAFDLVEREFALGPPTLVSGQETRSSSGSLGGSPVTPRDPEPKKPAAEEGQRPGPEGSLPRPRPSVAPEPLSLKAIFDSPEGIRLLVALGAGAIVSLGSCRALQYFAGSSAPGSSAASVDGGVDAGIASIKIIDAGPPDTGIDLNLKAKTEFDKSLQDYFSPEAIEPALYAAFDKAADAISHAGAYDPTFPVVTRINEHPTGYNVAATTSGDYATVTFTGFSNWGSKRTFHHVYKSHEVELHAIDSISGKMLVELKRDMISKKNPCGEVRCEIENIDGVRGSVSLTHVLVSYVVATNGELISLTYRPALYQLDFNKAEENRRRVQPFDIGSNGQPIQIRDQRTLKGFEGLYSRWKKRFPKDFEDR